MITTYIQEYKQLRKESFRTVTQGIQLEKKCLDLYKRIKTLQLEENINNMYDSLLKDCYTFSSEISWSLYRTLLPNEMNYFSLYQTEYQTEYEKEGVRFFVDLCAKKTNQSFSFQSLVVHQKNKKQITKKEWLRCIKQVEKETKGFPTFSELLSMDRSVI